MSDERESADWVTTWECPNCTAVNPIITPEPKQPCPECGEPYFDPMIEKAATLKHGMTLTIEGRDVYVVGAKSNIYDEEIMVVLMVPGDMEFRLKEQERSEVDGVGRDL